jgi:hypothetical protein
MAVIGENAACQTKPPVADRQLAHFFCAAKRNGRKKRPPRFAALRVLSISRKQAGLRNSTWQGAHPAPCCGTRTVLAQTSARLWLIETAHRGKRAKTKIFKSVGTLRPPSIELLN